MRVANRHRASKDTRGYTRTGRYWDAIASNVEGLEASTIRSKASCRGCSSFPQRRRRVASRAYVAEFAKTQSDASLSGSAAPTTRRLLAEGRQNLALQPGHTDHSASKKTRADAVSSGIFASLCTHISSLIGSASRPACLPSCGKATFATRCTSLGARGLESAVHAQQDEGSVVYLSSPAPPIHAYLQRRAIAALLLLPMQ
jgi:hypothetical protein